MERQKQNYRIGFPKASIYIVLSYALTGLGPTYIINRKLRAARPPSFLFVAGPIQGIQQTSVLWFLSNFSFVLGVFFPELNLLFTNFLKFFLSV